MMFETIEEIKEYLNETKIQCLECGKRYKSLAGHLRQSHAMEANWYRKKYQIPWTFALDCPETRLKKAKNADVSFLEDKWGYHPGKKKRKQCIAVKKQSSQNARKYNEERGCGKKQAIRKAHRTGLKRDDPRFRKILSEHSRKNAEKTGIINYWKGKKYTQEQLRKRYLSRFHKEMPLPKTEPLPGFPVDFKFQSREELDKYRGDDKIQCLRCGRYFRSLGVHLKLIHEMTPDQYREIYGIPWRDGLCCSKTQKMKSEFFKTLGRNRKEKGWIPGEYLFLAKKAKHRKFQPMTIERCKKHIHDVNEKLGNNTGKTKDKLEKQSKKNTPEYHEKMRNRPQVANPKFIGWWKGKKQSKEHIEKRMNSSKPGDNS